MQANLSFAATVHADGIIFNRRKLDVLAWTTFAPECAHLNFEVHLNFIPALFQLYMVQASGHTSVAIYRINANSRETNLSNETHFRPLSFFGEWIACQFSAIIVE